MNTEPNTAKIKHCHNNHCHNRDICLYASKWRPEQPVFFGDEKDCADFEPKEETHEH